MAKVVAISFGRKMSNTDVMLKEVLKKCAEAGHEIQFVRPDDLKIGACTGCCACVVGIMSGLTHWGRLSSFLLTAFYSCLILIPLDSLIFKIGLIGGNTWKE